MELAHFWGILFISLHAMVPITLAAIGETIEESAGLFNIGLEGILLLGALAGALGAQASGSAVIGLMTGIGIGAMVGLIFGTIGTTLRGSQLITGVGINLFALGFVALMLSVMGAPGFHSVARDVQVPLIPLGVGTLSPLVSLLITSASNESTDPAQAQQKINSMHKGKVSYARHLQSLFIHDCLSILTC